MRGKGAPPAQPHPGSRLCVRGGGTSWAMRLIKAVGKDSALQVFAESFLHVDWWGVVVALAVELATIMVGFPKRRTSSLFCGPQP